MHRNVTARFESDGANRLTIDFLLAPIPGVPSGAALRGTFHADVVADALGKGSMSPLIEDVRGGMRLTFAVREGQVRLRGGAGDGESAALTLADVREMFRALRAAGVAEADLEKARDGLNAEMRLSTREAMDLLSVRTVDPLAA